MGRSFICTCPWEMGGTKLWFFAYFASNWVYPALLVWKSTGAQWKVNGSHMSWPWHPSTVCATSLSLLQGQAEPPRASHEAHGALLQGKKKQNLGPEGDAQRDGAQRNRHGRSQVFWEMGRGARWVGGSLSMRFNESTSKQFVLYVNPRIFWAGRDPQGSNPALKWTTPTGMECPSQGDPEGLGSP